MTALLSDEEKAVREEIERHLGIDGSGVMRQGMWDLARKLGIKISETSPKSRPKGR